MTGMKVELSDRATTALRVLAVKERRDLRREAEHLIEAELQRRGLLGDEPRQPKDGAPA